MSTPSIDDMNEAIAIFDGWELVPDHEIIVNEQVLKVDCFIKERQHPKFHFDLKYHSSWDALMPVIEKIQELKEWREDKKELRLFSTITIDIEFDGHYKKSRCSIIGTITYCHNESIPHTYTEVPVPHIWVADKKTAIEAVYNAVYQFITWYNQQKHSTTNEQ